MFGEGATGSSGDTTVTDLPMVGEPDIEGRLTSYLNLLRTEATTQRGVYTSPHQECLNLYMYGNVSGADEPHTFPKIQGMINAKVSQMARQVPNICLKSASLDDGGPTVMTTSGQPRILDSDAITDFLQHAVDRLLYRSGFKSFYRRMAFYASLYGWQDALIDCDDQSKKLVLRILPALQWYKDPTAEFIEDMAYIGMDWPIDAEIAKRLYPHLADQITAAAQRAVYFTPSASGYSDVFVNPTYARPIVTLSIWWLRNREVRMTPDEAQSLGFVSTKMVDAEGSPNGPAPGVVAEPAGDTGEPESEPASEPAPGDSEGQQPAEPGGNAPADAGMGAPGAAQPAPKQRQAFFHSMTGEEVTPAHENWPMKLVLSETIQILDEIVSDKECEYPDIPVVSNFNVKIPNRPYGQSDCIRVKSSQVDTNRLNANMVEHSEWFRGPICIMPKSVKADMPAEVRNSGMQPNVTMWIEEAALKRLLETFNGKPIGWFDPPQMPPALLAVKRELDQNFDVSGGRPEVSQGQAPTANASGELAKVLLDASQQQNDFTSMDAEEMCVRVGKMALHYVLNEWTVEDHMKVNRIYPPPVVQMLLNTAKEEMEWELEVDTTVARQQHEQQVRQDFQLGLVDAETARDVLKYDNAQIEQRQQQAAVAAAQSQAGQQQLQGQGRPGQPAPHPPGGQLQSAAPQG